MIFARSLRQSVSCLHASSVLPAHSLSDSVKLTFTSWPLHWVAGLSDTDLCISVTHWHRNFFSWRLSYFLAIRSMPLPLVWSALQIMVIWHCCSHYLGYLIFQYLPSMVLMHSFSISLCLTASASPSAEFNLLPYLIGTFFMFPTNAWTLTWRWFLTHFEIAFSLLKSNMVAEFKVGGRCRFDGTLVV